MTRKFKFVVDWDDAPNDVPRTFEATIDVPDDVELVDWLSDWLSDKFGFCHNGFTYEEV